MKTIRKNAPFDLDKFELSMGGHSSVAKGACAMELVAYMAGEKHSDHPACACPVISSYVRALNDRFGDKERQLLKPYLKRIIETKDENSLKRAKILAHAALTVFAAKAMDSANLPEQAEKLRACVFGDWKKNRQVALEARDTTADAAYAAANAATYAAANAAANAAAYAATYAANAAASASAASASASASAANAATSREEVVKEALRLLDEVLNLK